MGTKAGAKRVGQVNVRCGPEFKAWVVEFAARERATPSQLVDRGLAALAKAAKFAPPPPR